MTLGQHAGYILGAYAFTALVSAGLIVHALARSSRPEAGTGAPAG